MSMQGPNSPRLPYYKLRSVYLKKFADSLIFHPLDGDRSGLAIATIPAENGIRAARRLCRPPTWKVFRYFLFAGGTLCGNRLRLGL